MKRIFSLFLALALVLVCLPISATAQDAYLYQETSTVVPVLEATNCIHTHNESCKKMTTNNQAGVDVVNAQMDLPKAMLTSDEETYFSHMVTTLEESAVSGNCGDNLTWVLDEDGTLTISGTGEMSDYTGGGPWSPYHKRIKSIVIENGVTSIGAWSFFGQIGGENYDAYYPLLKEIKIADTVTIIKPSAFRDNPGIKSIRIPGSVKEIGACAFTDCYFLTEVTLEPGLEIIGDHVFDVCSFSQIEIPQTVKNIGVQAFSNNDFLTEVVIPEGVELVGSWAFVACKNLTSVTVPASVKTMGENPFSSNPSLREIRIDPGNANYCAVENSVYSKDMKVLYAAPGVGQDTYTVNDSVTTIADAAFYGNKNLTRVIIPASVQSIGRVAFMYADKLATIVFYGDCPEFSKGIFYGVTATAYYPEYNASWTASSRQNYEGKITWIAFKKSTVLLENEIFSGHDTVWIEGLPYPIQGEGNDRYVELPTEDDCYMVTYTYHTGDAADVHTQYPTGMKVYKVSNGEITHIPELDNLLQYSGASIRITGKKGIRMITSLTKTNKTALTGKGLAGFKLLEYGTALCFAHEIPQGDALVLGRDFTRSNYAYKKGVADPVFASTKDLIQYTNVLVGFSLDQCKDDIAMRPYIILEDAAGNQITLYGGTIYRSIGYIAYQNRTVFKPKTASYNYVWELIHHVYGDKYDADYKG